MKKSLTVISLCILGASAVFAQALDTEKWPPKTDFSAEEVHYWSGDDFLTAAIPSGKGNYFEACLSVLTGGDQVTADVTIGGKSAKKANTTYFNVADELYFIWPEYPVVDVLVQYFANSESKRADFGFLLGQLGNLHGVSGYSFESVTDAYEWRLFRIDNVSGWLGNDLSGSGPYGGVNGGTIRFERVSGVIFRAIAIGPEGAFGEPEDINTAKTVEFNPDDYAILAEWDLNKGVVNGLDLYKVTSGDQETIVSDDVGPANDKRKAARPAMDNGTDGIKDLYVNWAILNEQFGPASQPGFRVKVVAEYYDDPALVGIIFGPEAYKTAGDQIAFYPEANRTVIQGTDRWMEAEWYVPDVKLSGVNVSPQGAARFAYSGPVFISRLRLGAIRTAGIYEGVDPIPDSYPFDPDPYGIYAELDLDKGLVDHLDMGGGGGDQEHIIDGNIGPAGDKRFAVRPALNKGTTPFDRYVNFAILDEIFGPSNQPNAVFKVAVDYYDDPALVGERFGPEVYQSSVFGTLGFKWYPTELRATIEGTGEWRTAAWQIDDMNFSGVNVGPQGAARFWYTDNGAIYISRVRYAVIRPKGKNAGVDMLADVPLTNVDSWELY
ncbi:MAG: hypothetical protein AB1656_17255 [Candidatus Omnitrophota bacterium]